jgi:hypothetical protein
LAGAWNSASITYQLCVSLAQQSRPAIICSAEIDAFIKRQLAEGHPPRIGCIDSKENNLGLLSLGSLLDLYPKYHALTEDEATHMAYYCDGGIEVVPKKPK